MPTWVDKSFALSEQGGYLDRLMPVYLPPSPGRRRVSQADLNMVREALLESDNLRLLHALLTLERFPFNHPYVSFLRRSPHEIASNPITVRTICEQVRSMGVEGVIDAVTRPKEQNRQMGPMFRNWLKKSYPHTSDVGAFEASSELLIFLERSGEPLRQFANRIGCGIEKQPDFVAKAKGRYVVGEAKWIGTEGGNENRAFEDALRLASSSFRRAVTIAVLDGIVWVRESGQMSRRLANFSGNALTALLLKEFLESL